MGMGGILQPLTQFAADDKGLTGVRAAWGTSRIAKFNH
jgi:hypothetical protein